MRTKKDALNFLTEAELLQIKGCIMQAEKLTSGEIRVVIASASSIIPKIRKKDKKRDVTRRAKSEFRKLGINKTRDTTGILILISLEERMVRVQPDKAIDDLLPQEVWQPFADLIIAGIKDGTPANGICKAVDGIGEYLSEHFPIRPGDTDELPNDVIIRGRW